MLVDTLRKRKKGPRPDYALKNELMTNLLLLVSLVVLVDVLDLKGCESKRAMSVSC